MGLQSCRALRGGNRSRSTWPLSLLTTTANAQLKVLHTVSRQQTYHSHRYSHAPIPYRTYNRSMHSVK